MNPTCLRIILGLIAGAAIAITSGASGAPDVDPERGPTQGRGAPWLSEMKCATCHQAPMMLWSDSGDAKQALDAGRVKPSGEATQAPADRKEDPPMRGPRQIVGLFLPL